MPMKIKAGKQLWVFLSPVPRSPNAPEGWQRGGNGEQWEALQGSSFSAQRCLWAVRVGRASY